MGIEGSKRRLLETARSIHGSIRYCGDATNWDDCFTIEFGTLHLWFNVGKDTKMIAVNLDGEDMDFQKTYCEDQYDR